MIFYTHVEHIPIKNNLHKVLYGNTHTHTHTHTHTAMHLNVHDTDSINYQYHTLCAVVTSIICILISSTSSRLVPTGGSE